MQVLCSGSECVPIRRHNIRAPGLVPTVHRGHSVWILHELYNHPKGSGVPHARPVLDMTPGTTGSTRNAWNTIESALTPLGTDMTKYDSCMCQNIGSPQAPGPSNPPCKNHTQHHIRCLAAAPSLTHITEHRQRVTRRQDPMQDSYYTEHTPHAITMRDFSQKPLPIRRKSLVRKVLEFHLESPGAWNSGQWYRAQDLHTGMQAWYLTVRYRTTTCTYSNAWYICEQQALYVFEPTVQTCTPLYGTVPLADKNVRGAW